MIRASELGQYRYCARAWWLGQVMGYRSTNVEAMQRGAEQHHDHGRSVVRYHRLRWIALALLVLAGLALVAWFLAGMVL